MKRDTEFWYSTALMSEGVRFSFHKLVGKKFERLESWQKDVKVAKWAAKDYVLQHDTGPKPDWPVTFTLYESREGDAIARIAVHVEWKLHSQVGFPISGEKV